MQTVNRHHLPNLEIVKIELDAGEIIPVHDHPERSGFLHVIKGKLDVTFYEIVKQDGDKLLFKATGQKQLVAGDESILTPTQNNIHTIEAIEDSIMLDSFSPKYDNLPDASCYQLTPCGDGLFKAERKILDDFNLTRNVQDHYHG